MLSQSSTLKFTYVPLFIHNSISAYFCGIHTLVPELMLDMFHLSCQGHNIAYYPNEKRTAHFGSSDLRGFAKESKLKGTSVRIERARPLWFGRRTPYTFASSRPGNSAPITEPISLQIISAGGLIGFRNVDAFSPFHREVLPTSIRSSNEQNLVDPSNVRLIMSPVRKHSLLFLKHEQVWLQSLLYCYNTPDTLSLCRSHLCPPQIRVLPPSRLAPWIRSHVLRRVSECRSA